MSEYPVSVVDDRFIPRVYDGPIHIWDIDKTYLATRFSSLRQLARIPFEFAIDKKAIPGMPSILRGIRRGTGPDISCTPLYFVSGSPPTLRPAIERKMAIDGVDFDGITFKDWLAIVRSMRLHRLRNQIGYKVYALLLSRLKHPLAIEYLYGDDVEFDAAAYCLYDSLLQPNLSPKEAASLLQSEGVLDDDLGCILHLFTQLPPQLHRVRQVFIHLERGSAPSSFSRFAPLVVPFRNAFQLGLALFEKNILDLRAVREAKDQVIQAAWPTRLNLEELVDDARERGLIGPEKAQMLTIVEPM